jgi:23S rRNA (guanosine2251-2'-O)-methyltransferase
MKRIIAGPNAVAEAIKGTPGRIEVICMAESMRPSSARRIEESARRAKIPVHQQSKSSLDNLSKGLNHQGVVAITGSYPYLDLDRLLEIASKEDNPLLVILDQVQDPRNLGAIMRSAHALGATGILITKDRSAAVTAATVRASAGASELINTVRVVNLVRAIDRLRDEGYLVHGAAVDNANPVNETSWTGRTAIVLGSEGRGLRRLTIEHCDTLFTIPLFSDFDSLNVSSAAAICLHEAAKQRFATAK